MMYPRGFPRQAAVLGAGLMGSQIAALLANAGIKVLLFDLPTCETGPNKNAADAIAQLHHLIPAPLTTPRRTQYITPATYAEHLDQLSDCDLLIEAISDDIDDKQGFYARIAPYINKHAIVTTCTSSLSINQLALVLPEGLRTRFCGTQFLNPPRYRRLVELIASDTTEPQTLDRLETFLVHALGKCVVRVKDSPFFVANRIGLFALLAAMFHAERYSLTPAQVDRLTAATFGLDKRAIFGTIDAIGLDQIAAAVNQATQTLPHDPWLQALQLPAWFLQLIKHNRLGDKTGSGIYRQQAGQAEVIDLTSTDYHPVETRIASNIQEILAIADIKERFTVLKIDTHPQAQFLWSILRDVIHYSAVWLTTIAETPRDIDSALKWGFNWQQGPFETWQSIGWHQLIDWLQQDLSAQKTLAQVELPSWIQDTDRAYDGHRAYAPSVAKYCPPSELSVYQRQQLTTGKSWLNTSAVSLWDDGADIAIINFNNPPTTATIDAFANELLQCLHIAENHHKALVLLNIDQLSATTSHHDHQLQHCQNLCLALRRAVIPVVATIDGSAQNYSTELQFYCDAVVTTMESQFGFPLLHTGVLPRSGGCTAIARRAQNDAKNNPILPYISTYFEHCTSDGSTYCAEEARDWGLLRSHDTIVFNPNELLYVAKIQANALAESGYRPPLDTTIRVAGQTGLAVLYDRIEQKFRAGQLNQQAVWAYRQFAAVLCGGNDLATSEYAIDEDQLLQLELRLPAKISEGNT